MPTVLGFERRQDSHQGRVSVKAGDALIMRIDKAGLIRTEL